MESGEEMAENKQQMEKNNTGILQWLLFIAIPLVFALTITFVILTMAGVDLGGFAKSTVSNIPGISALIQEEGEASSVERDEKEILQQELEKKQEELDALTAQTQMQERTIEEQNQEIVKLNNRLKDETTIDQKSTDEQIKNIARSFEEMASENAAMIVSNLDQEKALLVLKYIPTKERGLILEEMDPSQAANLTSAFISEP